MKQFIDPQVGFCSASFRNNWAFLRLVVCRVKIRCLLQPQWIEYSQIQHLWWQQSEGSSRIVTPQNRLRIRNNR